MDAHHRQHPRMKGGTPCQRDMLEQPLLVQSERSNPGTDGKAPWPWVLSAGDLPTRSQLGAPHRSPGGIRLGAVTLCRFADTEKVIT